MKGNYRGTKGGEEMGRSTALKSLLQIEPDENDFGVLVRSGITRRGRR